MRFHQTSVAGCWLVEGEQVSDKRGFLARSFCVDDFHAQGLATSVAQCSISYNKAKHTLRGLHYQCDPHGEAKLVSCHSGAIYDVAADVRQGSPTYRRWFGVRLDVADLLALYIPPGVAHGFLSLESDTRVTYQMSTAYHPESFRGVRWNDPSLDIVWPHEPEVISERDRTLPHLEAL